METEQTQELMEEGELVKLSIKSSSAVWSIYEGYIEGWHSFITQSYEGGYPALGLNSWRVPSRDCLDYYPDRNFVNLKDEIGLVRYDIDHPKNGIFVRRLCEKGVWANPFDN